MNIKIKINGTDIEGNADHIAFIIKSLGANPSIQQGGEEEAIDSGNSEMTKEFAELTLSRRPLSSAQRKLFRMLSRAGTGWVPSSEIMKKMDFNGNQHGGLFGAIGRRVAMTKGFKEGFTLFEWQWNEDREENDCRLHPAALEAMKRINP